MKSPGENLSNGMNLKTAIAILLAMIIWTFCLWRAIETFQPDRGQIDFNSDGAIPVLMANDARPITVYDTYYYGADRSGAWPLVVARLIRHSTGFKWDENRLHFARSIWLFLGILVLALLNRRAFFPVVLIGIAVICLPYFLWLRLFDLGQVYAWQITALLLSWLTIRKLLEPPARHADHSALRVAAISLAVFFFSLLATLSSPVSGPALCFVGAVETLRTFTIHKSSRRTLIRGFTALGLVLLAMVGEFCMRLNYHRHVQKHYQQDFRTAIGFDVHYLSTNLKTHLENILNFAWWPLIAFGGIAVIAGIVFLWRDSTRMAPVLAEETSFTILGAFGIAVINLVLVGSVEHVRISLYDNRYLTPTFFFGSISGLLVIWQTIQFAFRKLKAAYLAAPIFAGTLAVLIMLAFPPKLEGIMYRLRKQTALTLADRSPRAVLMGGYWETYVFAALQPTDRLTPLPLEGYQVRMPWSIDVLRNSSDVLVEYKHTKHEGNETPPSNLTQYGERMVLVDPKWYENSEYAFARYLRQPK